MPGIAMRNELDVLYDRWFASKNSVAGQMLQNQNSASVVLSTVKIRGLFESAGHHAAIQSDEFYQTLRVSHQGNPSAIKILDFLLQDLKMLRVELFAFAERYLGDRPAGQIKILHNDWAHLIERITQRIELEENQLGVLLRRDQKVGCQR